MSDNQTIARLRSLKPRLERWKIKRMRLFGSRVRNDYSKTSDIDLLVDFDQTPNLFDLAEMQHLIEDELGANVDLVFEDKIFPALRERILSEAQDV